MGVCIAEQSNLAAKTLQLPQEVAAPFPGVLDSVPAFSLSSYMGTLISVGRQRKF